MTPSGKGTSFSKKGPKALRPLSRREHGRQNSMTINIDYDKCNGCGICDHMCPMDIIHMDEEEKIPIVKYPDECWLCAICEMECPEEAIKVLLPQEVLLI
jgi:NAD-dependent dihydropyrimidine dehydrogenase PreA subunit